MKFPSKTKGPSGKRRMGAAAFICLLFGPGHTSCHRPSTQTWLVEVLPPVPIEQKGDIPVPGDYNRDGKTDVAVYRASTGQVIISGRETIPAGIINGKPLNLPYHIQTFFFPL